MSRSAYWVVLLLTAVVCLAGCARAPQPAADPGVDLSDPNVGGGAGQATGPETPIPTATATREGSPRIEGGAGVPLPTITPLPSPTPVPSATAAPAATPATLAPTEATATLPPAETDTAPTPPTATAPSAGTTTAAPAGERIHIVEAGENLYRIGLLYGLSWVTIAEYNGITDPNQITVGQELRIPPAPTATATGTVEAETTDDGQQTTDDRPQTTAGEQQTDERLPADDSQPPLADNLAVVRRPSSVVTIPTHTVAAGDTLYGISRLYGVDWAQVAEANGLATPNQLLPGQQIKIPPDVAGPTPEFHHRVHHGETLGGIAAQYGLPADALAQANALTAPYVIYAGQVLVIPGE